MMSSMESSPQSGLPGSISGRQTMLGENDDKQKNTDPEGKIKQKTIAKLECTTKPKDTTNLRMV